MKKYIVPSLALVTSLFAGNADAQNTCRPAEQQCAPRLRHRGLRIVGVAYNASTTICAANVATDDGACMTSYDTAPLPQQVEVVNGSCSGPAGRWRCRPSTPPPPPSPSSCCRDRPSGGSSGSSSTRASLASIKRLLNIYWARIILESGRIDALGRRMTSVEQVLREHGSYLDMLSDSVVTGFGIDEAALTNAAQRREGEINDDAAIERVAAVYRNGSQAFRDAFNRLGDRTTVLERRADFGGTRFEPGTSVQLMSVGPAVATTAGVTIGVEHRVGTGDGAYIGGRWNGGAGGQSGIPATVFSSVTEVYAGYRVAPFVGLQAGAFHTLVGRMDECNSATEPCGIQMHGGGAEVGVVFGGQGLGPVNIDANFMIGYGTGRSHNGTSYTSSEGALIGGNLRLTLRFQ